MLSKYEIELWSRNGILLADITSLVTLKNFSQTRNDAEDLHMTLHLEGFEALAASIGANPSVLLNSYQTDIKIKRNGEYLFGTHVGNVTVNLGEVDKLIEVDAFGYLNLLIDRYVTKTYTQEYETDIAWDLINETQSQTNGDMGFTLGDQHVELVQRDRTYVRQNVKEAIVNLTNLVNGNFDFEFTHDKKFNTYAMIGSDRTNVLNFSYPGNIKEVIIPRDGLSLYNKIYGLGSGFGEDQLISIQEDEASQLNYGVHEKIVTFNSVVEQSTLDQNTTAQVDLRKEILEIPQMIVSGDDFDLNTYGVGDRVHVEINDHPFLANINGTYRIERIEVTPDQNDSEVIKIYFDDYGIGE